MAYDGYQDSNGVHWTIVTTGNGFTMLATVLDEADPKYDPPAEDLVVKMAQGGVQLGDLDLVHTDPPTAEQTRTLFIELAGKIEAYAKAHRGPTLRVNVAKPIPWWVWALLGLAVLKSRRR